MNQDLTKRAADLLLQGATLVSEPCPYCKGVRVIKDGNALCTSCGRTPKKEATPQEEPAKKKPNVVLDTLEKKLADLAKELESQKDHQKQQEIIRSIDSLINTIDKLKK